jgi:hypothetical protein
VLRVVKEQVVNPFNRNIDYSMLGFEYVSVLYYFVRLFLNGFNLDNSSWVVLEIRSDTES